MTDYRRFAWLTVLPCWGLIAGCNLVPTSSVPPPATKAAAPPLAAAKSAEPEHKFKPERVSQFVFYSDVEISRKNPLFRELSDMREHIVVDLHLLLSNSLVHVHLFENQDRYEKFVETHHPELPRRRAFFVHKPKLGGDELLVYTYWSDKITQDLRHEITHALLHGSLKGVPIWLDEGLAQYYEMGPNTNGINYAHAMALQKSLAGGQKMDLARLETLDKVGEMHQGEYREAWAWVHFMMHSTPEARQVLVHYLRELRSNARPGPLRPALEAAVPNLDIALERHLAAIGQGNGNQLAER